MPRKYEVISADGHLETPHTDWVKYVPEVYKDRVPRRVKTPKGGDAWLVEGQPMFNSGRAIFGGRWPVKFRDCSYWNPDGTLCPGTGSPTQRLQEQDQDGIDAEVLFPSFHGSRLLEYVADKTGYYPHDPSV